MAFRDTDIVDELKSMISYQGKDKSEGSTSDTVSVASSQISRKTAEDVEAVDEDQIPAETTADPEDLDLIDFDDSASQVPARRKLSPQPNAPDKRARTNTDSWRRDVPTGPKAMGDAVVQLNRLVQKRRLKADYEFHQLGHSSFVAALSLYRLTGELVFLSTFDQRVEESWPSKREAKEAAARQGVDHLEYNQQLAAPEPQSRRPILPLPARRFSTSYAINPRQTIMPRQQRPAPYSRSTPQFRQGPSMNNVLYKAAPTFGSGMKGTDDDFENWVGIVHEYCQRSKRPPPHFDEYIVTNMRYAALCTIYAESRKEMDLLDGDDYTIGKEVFGNVNAVYNSKKSAKHAAARDAVLAFVQRGDQAMIQVRGQNPGRD